MTPSDSRNGHEADSIPEGGILAALPRARPQRASARRSAARTSKATRMGTAGAETAAATKRGTKSAQAANAKNIARDSSVMVEPVATKKPAARKPVATKRVATKKAAPTKKRATKPIAKPVEPPVPKQGYEPEEELELGKSVNPPSGAELVESMADIIGELANSGRTAGGRLLKDAFSLLRRP